MKREYNLKARYNISIDEYNTMLVRQNGVCAICQQPPADGKILAVDHSHYHGVVRSLLCQQCNSGLAYFKEDIYRMTNAIKYIRDHPSGGYI